MLPPPCRATVRASQTGTPNRMRQHRQPRSHWWMMCATHSQPARVLSACWKGAVASSAWWANCFARVLDTKQQKRSPTTISCGTSPLANVSANDVNNSVSAPISSIGANALLSFPKDPLLRPAWNFSKCARRDLRPARLECRARGSQPAQGGDLEVQEGLLSPKGHFCSLKCLPSCRQFAVQHTPECAT